MKMKLFEKIRDFDRFDDNDDQLPDRHEFGSFSTGKEEFALVGAGELSKPAAWWAFEIEARRRAIVAGASRATKQEAM